MNEIFVLTGHVFLVVFLILCLYKIYVASDVQLCACPCSLKKKKQNKKHCLPKWVNLFNVCVFTTHNQGFVAIRVSGSTLQS